jgi:hypothetical protein
MTSWECYENKWFYMKYIEKMAETESLLSTCGTQKSKDRATRTKKNWGELKCSVNASSSCSTSGFHCVKGSSIIR